MKKKILLIGYNFYPEPTGIGKYNGEMMAWLSKSGYDCEVITSYPYYPFWKVQKPYFKNRFWYNREKDPTINGKLIIHRCPMYIPEKPTGLKRILLDFSFLITAFFKVIQLSFGRKFDLVITVAPSFQFGLLGILYQTLRNSKLLYHIQDLQIEAARDLGMIKSKGLTHTLFKVEKFIFDRVNYISSISEGMIQRIEEKAAKKVYSFPNWADTNVFYPLENKAALKEEFGFAPLDIIILYSGAIGEKQGLEAILYAALEFKYNENVKFLICGSGPYKENLQHQAEESMLRNVIFFPLQPFEKFNNFLNMADLHLVIQKGNASDLVMPSKLTTILAVGGVALVTADKGSSLYSVIQKHKIGLLVLAENQDALNKGIKQALMDNNDQFAKNARAFAQANLSIDGVMQQFEKDFFTELITGYRINN